MARTKTQTEIPGTEQVEHEDVESAAEDYIQIQDQRRTIAEQGRAAKQALIDAMKDHGVTSYRFDDHVVTAGTRDVVNIKKQKAPSNELPGGED